MPLKTHPNIRFYTFKDDLLRIVFINKEPWYVAQDICDALGYKNPTKAIEQHCKNATLLNSKDFFDHTPSLNLTIIPYLDLCRLLMHAGPPKFGLIKSSPPSSAKKKLTQSYITKLREVAVCVEKENKDTLCAQAIREFADFVAEKHLHETAKDDPRTHLFEQKLRMVGNNLTLPDIAKAFSEGKTERFMKWLREIEVLPSIGDVPYQEHINSGKFLLMIGNYGGIGYCTINVTPQGIWWLRELWLEHLSKAEEMSILEKCLREYIGILD